MKNNSTMSEYDCSLYIHWPFCPYRCSYCPFIALAGQDAFMERYHLALKSEIERYSNSNARQKIKTVFLGGGTPSTYPSNLLLDMFGTLKGVFDFDRVQEITIEVNPGTVQMQHLQVWHDIGINRISIGVQSLDEAILRKLHRFQSNADVYWLLNACTRYFENVSIDLMIGLPGISDNEWESFLKEVVSWPIKHVSIYCLTVHEQTPLYFELLKHEIKMPSDDNIAETYIRTIEFLHQQGFVQYEVSNCARAGYESLHNKCYWERFPYKGFGLSACSFDGRRRTQNDSNLMNYLKKIEKNQDIIIFEEDLNDEQVRLEKIMLGLRCARGISLDLLLQGATSEKQKILQQKISIFSTQGLLKQTDNVISLSTRGFALENEIITQLSE